MNRKSHVVSVRGQGLVCKSQILKRSPADGIDVRMRDPGTDSFNSCRMRSHCRLIHGPVLASQLTDPHCPGDVGTIAIHYGSEIYDYGLAFLRDPLAWLVMRLCAVRARGDNSAECNIFCAKFLHQCFKPVRD